MVVITGEFVVDAETREDALVHIRELVLSTRTEPGCLTYGFYQAIEDNNVHRLYAEWESMEAVETHYGSDHLRAFSQQLENFGLISASMVRLESPTVTRLL